MRDNGGADVCGVRSQHSDPLVQAGLGSAYFLLPLLSPLCKRIFKTQTAHRLLLMRGNIFICLQQTVFKEQLPFVPFSFKTMVGTNEQHFIILILEQDLAGKWALKHAKCRAV